MRLADAAAAGLLAALGALTLLVFIPGTIDDPGMDDLSPAFAPQVAAALLTGLAVLLALGSAFRKPADDEQPLDRRHAGFVALVAAWLAAAFLCTWLAGYLIGGAVSVAGAMLLMGIRRPALIGAVACGAPLVLWAAFWQILTIPLP